ncbi:MAG: single-stranded DNA-binding protein, partial [Cyclobacteriaceae bacterium]|nr:single-stranded DNA-binding protein [Cyclobacteriaceae bacterium]
MSGVNKVILIGRLGKDPEVRSLESGVMVANFTIATSEVYRDRNTGERKETTESHNIVLWRNLAEIAQKYLHKGDIVYMEGKLRNRSWEKDGITRYTTEIVADNMAMLSASISPIGVDEQSTNNNSSSHEGISPATDIGIAENINKVILIGRLGKDPEIRSLERGVMVANF